MSTKKITSGRIQWKYYANYIAIAAVALFYTVMSLTGNIKSSETVLLEKISIAIILATSLGMVVGFLGELSLGHAGFMCVGAYLGGKVSALLAPTLGNGVLTLIIAVLVGGIAAAVFGMIIGLPALRLRGDYLAIVTLAFGEIVRTVVMNLPESLFGGTLGLKTPRFNNKHLFIISFALVLVCLAVTQNILRSKHGRAITSIRDNEIAARATGIDVTKYKLFIFTISSFFAGIAGVLFSYTQSRVQSANFDYNYSIEILVMVVLGGIGSINGSIISAALITFLNIKLQTLLPGDLAVLQNLLYAVILIAIVIYNNAPKLKTFRETHNLRTSLSRLLSKKKAAKSQDNEGKEEA
ncbi:MAG: branched-chain amino acid ABC transporter permease [Clostridia bacterium]|nr:branched-chain amino acid ABC transporter permease [Clostridia bacterium]